MYTKGIKLQRQKLRSRRGEDYAQRAHIGLSDLSFILSHLFFLSPIIFFFFSLPSLPLFSLLRSATSSDCCYRGSSYHNYSGKWIRLQRQRLHVYLTFFLLLPFKFRPKPSQKKKPCSQDGCNSTSKGRGLCDKHGAK